MPRPARRSEVSHFTVLAFTFRARSVYVTLVDDNEAKEAHREGASGGHGPEGPSPTGPVVGERNRTDVELPAEAQPKGAIMVTSVVAVTIMVLFFGVLAILWGRA